MTKSTHSTVRRRPATGGTAETSAAPSTFIDPTTLPDEYAMRVCGDCLAPAIKGGDSVLVDQRQPYAAGNLVCVSADNGGCSCHEWVKGGRIRSPGRFAGRGFPCGRKG